MLLSFGVVIVIIFVVGDGDYHVFSVVGQLLVVWCCVWCRRVLLVAAVAVGVLSFLQVVFFVEGRKGGGGGQYSEFLSIV